MHYQKETQEGPHGQRLSAGQHSITYAVELATDIFIVVLKGIAEYADDVTIHINGKLSRTVKEKLQTVWEYCNTGAIIQACLSI